MRLKLKEILENFGISQREFAYMIDLSEPTVSMLCTGKITGISFDTLENICLTLKMTPNDLFELPDLEE